MRNRVSGLNGSGIHLRKRRLIMLRRWDDAPLMTGTLVHEMAHAATNDWHGPRWAAEMERLRQAGAPVQDVDFRPPMRLTRNLVLSCAADALCDGPDLTLPAFADWFAREYRGGSSGGALLRSYPWIRAVFRDARLGAMIQTAAGDEAWLDG